MLSPTWYYTTADDADESWYDLKADSSGFRSVYGSAYYNPYELSIGEGLIPYGFSLSLAVNHGFCFIFTNDTLSLEPVDSVADTCPSPVPTPVPIPAPTVSVVPTPAPTPAPTLYPSIAPTQLPTPIPSNPTTVPIPAPTAMPTPVPTIARFELQDIGMVNYTACKSHCASVGLQMPCVTNEYENAQLSALASFDGNDVWLAYYRGLYNDVSSVGTWAWEYSCSSSYTNWHFSSSADSCTDLGWTNAASYGSSTVCGESDLSPLVDCSGSLSYEDATDFCLGVGARLCTLDEMSNDEARGTGCDYDYEQLWTQTSCGDDSHYTQYGASHQGDSISCASDSETRYVRCCADTADTAVLTVAQTSTGACAVLGGTSSIDSCTDLGWTNADTYGSSAVCGESDLSPLAGCSGSLSYEDATNFCLGVGARLCTLDEMSNDEVRGTGCNYADDQLWTQTSCGDDSHYTQYGSSGAGDSSSCASDSETRYVRCCADKYTDASLWHDATCSTTTARCVCATPVPSPVPTPVPTLAPTVSVVPTPFIAQSCIELAQSGYLCGGAARWLIDPNGGDTSDAFPVRCQPSGGLTLTPGDSDNALCTSFAYRYSTVCGGSNDADCLPSQAESGLPDAAYTQACGV